MVDRLEIIPGDVRGGGNITTTKQDFKRDNNTNVYHTKLTESNTFVNGKLMTVFRSSKTDGWNVSFDAPRVVCPGDTVTVNFTASHLHEGSSIHDISATLFLRSLDGETVFWEDNYSSYNLPTSFTVTVPEDCDSVCEWFLFISHSVYQNASLHRSVIVSSDLELDLDVFSDKQIIQTGETANIVGLLTDTIGESVIGVPGQTVNFYETFTPGLRVSAPVVQSGDTVDIHAQLIDTTDGSLVRESGHTVNMYLNDPPAPVPTTLEFIPNRTILSYADHQFVQLVVDVYDQFGEGLHDLTVVFKKNGVVFDTKVTYYGTATCNYWSAGDGDVVFTAECEGLSESVTIEDCWNAILTESNISNSSGTKISSIGLDTVHNVQSDDFILEFDGKGNGVLNIGAKTQWSSSSSADYRATIGVDSNIEKPYYAIRTTSTDDGYGSSFSLSDYHHYKIVKDGSTVDFYCDNAKVGTKTTSFWSSYNEYSIYSIIWGSGTQYYKNVRIKPL